MMMESMRKRNNLKWAKNKHFKETMINHKENLKPNLENTYKRIEATLSIINRCKLASTRIIQTT